MTRCWIFNSKPDFVRKNFLHILIFSHRNSFKIRFFWKPLLQNPSFKKNTKSDNFVVLRSKLTQNLIFQMRSFFQNLILRNALQIELCLFKIILLRNQQEEKLSIQNLTCCNFFNSETDFQTVFPDSRWNSIKVLPASKNSLLETDNGLGKRIFYEYVACVCVIAGTISLPYAFF